MQILPFLDKSYFVEEPTDTDVVPGGTIVFRCQARGANGQPLQNIRWTQDGKDITAKAKVLRDGTLIIRSASAVHVVGWYQCHAGGGDTGQEAIVSRRARVRFYRGRAKPVILQSPAEMTEVEKGSSIRLGCIASGFPRPLFAWYKDGGRLSTAHSRYTIEENGTLVITNAQLGDSGHYRCSASNYLGRASSAARVKVNLNIPEAAPRITSFPRDASINEGLFVEFTCVASGHPYPDVSWWNNNIIIVSGGRIQVSNGGQHLRIEDGQAYDSGLYTCRAQNRLGYIEASAKLEVKSSRTAIPLELITVPHDMVAPAGTTVQLPCQAEGFPRPEIQWLKDGHVMSTELRRFDIRPDGSLIVQNVTQEDEGMYECVADNGQERISAQARFSIRETREISNEAFTYTSVDEDPVGSSIGDQFVLVALEEALVDVDKALNSTLDALFSSSSSNAFSNASSRELIRIFRYPPENQRGVARAAEVFERTLDLVAEKVKSIENHPSSSSSFANFTYQDLVSPYNLELIGNLSGKLISLNNDLILSCHFLIFRVPSTQVTTRGELYQGPLLP